MPKYAFINTVVAQATATQQQLQSFVQQQVTQVQTAVSDQVTAVVAQQNVDDSQFATKDELAAKQDKGDYVVADSLPTLLSPSLDPLIEQVALQAHEISTLSDASAVQKAQLDTHALTLDGLTSVNVQQTGQINQQDTRIAANASNVSALTTRVASAESSITNNASSIANNTTAISANTTKLNTLGTLATRNTISYNELTGTPDVNGLTTRVSTAETAIAANTSNVTALTTRVGSAETAITSNTTKLGTLGTLATKSTVDYNGDVINKPTLGTLAAKNSIDYVNDLINKPTLYQSPMYRNRIINGDFSVMQRIHSGTLDVVWADRWVLTSTTATTSSGPWPTQSRLGPGNGAPGGTAYYMRVSTFSSSTVATSELQRLVQVIEGGMVQDLEWGTSQGKPMVLSFWTHHSLAGTYSVTIRQANPTSATTAQSYVAEYQQINTSVWEQKVISIPPPPAGTAWVTVNTENLGAIELAFVLNGSGSATATSNVNTWISPTNSTIGCSTNQINLWTLSTTTNQSLRIGAVQFEPGTVNTPFEWRPRSIEETLCKRYCQMVVANQTYACVGTGYFWSTTAAYVMLDLQVNLRDPVNYGIAVSKPSDWCVQSATGAGVFPFSTLGIAGQTQCGTSLMLYGTLSVAGTQNAPCLMTANNTTAAYIRVSAEFSPPSL